MSDNCKSRHSHQQILSPATPHQDWNYIGYDSQQLDGPQTSYTCLIWKEAGWRILQCSQHLIVPQSLIHKDGNGRLGMCRLPNRPVWQITLLHYFAQSIRQQEDKQLVYYLAQEESKKTIIVHAWNVEWTSCRSKSICYISIIPRIQILSNTPVTAAFIWSVSSLKGLGFRPSHLWYSEPNSASNKRH